MARIDEKNQISVQTGIVFFTTNRGYLLVG